MVSRGVVRFARLLRGLGLSVSSSEIMDALECLAAVDLSDREQVKLALRSVLVKRVEDMASFDRAFELYFIPLQAKKKVLELNERRRAEKQEMLDRAEKELRFLDRPLALTDAQKEIYARLAPAERRRLQEFLEKSSKGKNVGPSFTPIIENLVAGHLKRIKKDIPTGESHLEVSTGDPELDALIERLASEPGAGGDPILFCDLKNVSEKELPRVAALTEALARRLASHISRRYKLSRRRHRIDIRRTIRSNIRFGGALMCLRFKSKKIQKPRIVLICDVSGSMIKYTNFLLQFVYGMSNVMGRIESFVFSDDLVRVTEYFQHGKPFQETMRDIVDHSGQWGRGTNLGAALGSFLKYHADFLTPSTFVIITSDTKTISPESAGELLAAVRGRVKEILWLNTLPRSEWNDHPSVEVFSRSTRMVECYTLAHLERILRNQLLEFGKGLC